MGFTSTRVAHPAGREDAGDIDRAIDALMTVSLVPPIGRWAILEVSRPQGVPSLVSVVNSMRSLAKKFDLPSLVTHVEDSDCSIMCGILPPGDSVTIAFNRDALNDYEDPAALAEAVEESAEGFSRWANQARQWPIDVEVIEGMLNTEWTSAEEPVSTMGDMLGLPHLGAM